MYIKNLEELKIPMVKTSVGIGEYLELHCGFSRLGQKDKYLYFVDSNKLRESLKSVPFFLRMLGSYEFVNAKGGN